MSILRLAAATLAAPWLCLASFPAIAQSTDAYHAIQVLPVVVETASFVSRIIVRNPFPNRSLTLSFTYVPASGTSQLTPLQCPDYTLVGTHTFESLRAICPSLPSGSQFGFLHVRQTQSQRLGESTGTEVGTFSMYSRVSNAAGNGFSVEAFPAHVFTSARSVVAGLRRTAATADSPAFQTNCFIGNLNDVTPDPAPVATRVDFSLFGNANLIVGAGSVTLVPGQMVRLLDVFDAAGAGDYDFDNVRIDFIETGDGEPSLITFCTVQDNTSFGADFRIGKPEQSISHVLPGYFVGGQDDHVLRDSTLDKSITLSEGAGAASTRAFSLGPGALINTHLFYFRHPDYVQCELIDPATGQRAAPALGLEMRLLASDGETVIAGGNNVTGFSRVYLGDKRDRDEGSNSRYSMEVEATGSLAATVNYGIRCQSGSGHSLGELLRTGPTPHF